MSKAWAILAILDPYTLGASEWFDGELLGFAVSFQGFEGLLEGSQVCYDKFEKCSKRKSYLWTCIII